MSPPAVPRAVVFDVDGTLADTERDGHRVAFNQAFAAHGIDLVWGEAHYGRLLAVTGGRRRIVADLCHRHGRGEFPADETALEELAARVHRTKTELFAAQVHRGAIAPRPGVVDLVEDLRACGVRIGVATTGRRAWAEPLAERLLGRRAVTAAVYGDDVWRLKPDPEVYTTVLERLDVRADEAVAIEDSAPGLAAARAAGLATVVVTNGYTREHDLRGAALVREEFDRPALTVADLCALVRAPSVPSTRAEGVASGDQGSTPIGGRAGTARPG